MHYKSLIIVLSFFALLMPPMQASAQEHPEHPMNRTAPMEPKVTKEDLAKAITGYIETEQAKSSGFYMLKDPEENKSLMLTLDRVHNDKLAQTGPGEYFACADFKVGDGTPYDLDFFMKGSSKDDLAFGSFSIHKKNGKERYRWALEDGVWKRMPPKS